MNQSVADQVKAAGIRAIAVNTTFKLAPWADLLYAADERWWKVWWNHEEAQASRFAGLKVACERTPFPEVKVLKNSGVTGFDPNPNSVRIGGNGGYQAVHVAVHAGCKRILLCGFDMRGDHWHGRHPEPLRNHGEQIYVRWIQNFATLAKELPKDVEVINCTPGSALKVFPFQDLSEALARTESATPAVSLSA